MTELTQLETLLLTTLYLAGALSLLGLAVVLADAIGAAMRRRRARRDMLLPTIKDRRRSK